MCEQQYADLMVEYNRSTEGITRYGFEQSLMALED